MRLSMDEVRKQHDGIKKLYEQGLRGATASVEQVLDLFDTIEALQQENEQLQAQVARMREALIIANHRMPDVGHFCTCGKCKRCGTDINYAGYKYCLKCARNIIDAALSDTPADYHNPADVEALRKAREVLYNLRMDDYPGFSAICEALTAIDKVIGGKEI